MSNPSDPGFVAAARGRNRDRLAAILDHPFNRELADGSLDRERFRFYVAQDAHYLVAFARALTITAGRAPTREAHRRLLHLAGEGLDGERGLHAAFGVDASIPAGPACAAYGDFLLATAACGSYGDSLAALLPCYSVYAEVAGAIAADAAPDNPYLDWIATYDGDAFAANVRDVAALAEGAAAAVSDAARVAMDAAYDRSVVHEWCFWDAAYHRRMWPI